MYKDLYQRIYEDKNLHYGQAEYNRCPGTRFFSKYKDWLVSRIIDLGCGTGDTVRLLKSHGYSVVGIDQVELDNNMIVGDICSSSMDLSNYSTSLCIDVFEHLDDEHLHQLLENMKQTTRQVISVFSGPSKERGIDLHINIKTLEEWQSFINKYLNIQQVINVSPNRQIYLCINDRPIKGSKVTKTISLNKVPGIRTFSDGSVILFKRNKETEQYLDSVMYRVSKNKWRPYKFKAPNLYPELLDTFKEGICYVIGKGPSLDNLDKNYFLDNIPIICINESIHRIESLGLSNPIFCIQQDQKLKNTCKPKYSPMFISLQIFDYYKDIKHYLYLPEQFGFKGSIPTVSIALKILESLNVKKCIMYAFDARVSGDCNYANSIGYTPEKFGKKTRFLKQKINTSIELIWR